MLGTIAEWNLCAFGARPLIAPLAAYVTMHVLSWFVCYVVRWQE